jgi:AcrR family transcriptional regulator
MATRARLLSGGRALFAEHGLHRVTSHDIARAAGVAAGTFYLHFSDKQSLFREIVYEAVRQLREQMETAFESTLDARQDAKLAVRAHAEALVDFARAYESCSDGITVTSRWKRTSSTTLRRSEPTFFVVALRSARFVRPWIRASPHRR